MKLVKAGRWFPGSILMCGMVMAVLAAAAWDTAAYGSTVNPAPFLMAGDTGTNQGGGGGSDQGSGQPLPGQLIVPGSSQPGQGDKNNKKGKQCMTTCAQWGEECMLVNQGAGGMQRRCRHVCKQFAEECF